MEKEKIIISIALFMLVLFLVAVFMFYSDKTIFEREDKMDAEEKDDVGFEEDFQEEVEVHQEEHPHHHQKHILLIYYNKHILLNLQCNKQKLLIKQGKKHKEKQRKK